ncbi:MAG TPA: GNAT family N-acetyltransferase [Aeromicrobium sp.]|nr:GNAT family N-acetyltransferase [Aeromicrobium sp.]
MNATRVTTEQEAGAAAVLADAFFHDPVVSWMYPNARKRRERFRRMTARMLALTRDRNHVLRTDGNGACSYWMPPGEPPLTLGEQLRTVMPSIPALARRLPQTLALLDLMDRKHPKEPHWYLFLVGSDPARRGQGHGIAVIRPVLEQCDRQGTPAYLENSNPVNAALYERLGFVGSGELRRAGSPPLVPMWREPRTG